MSVRAYLIFILCIASALASSASNSVPPKEFEYVKGAVQVPKTQFSNETGAGTTLTSFSDRIVILNLWATWCAPCVKEMPSLERLSNLLPSDKFAVVAVNQDKGGAAIARSFLESIGVHSLPLYLDPNGRLMRDLSIRGLPTTVIVSGNGTVIGKLEGTIEWDAEPVVAFLKTLSN